jgi:hypothetical protein
LNSVLELIKKKLLGKKKMQKLLAQEIISKCIGKYKCKNSCNQKKLFNKKEMKTKNVTYKNKLYTTKNI